MGVGECVVDTFLTCTLEGLICDAEPAEPPEETEVTRDDGRDNDCEGLIDEADDDCEILLTYSEEFIGGQSATETFRCSNWQDFRASLSASSTSISMGGTFGATRTCSNEGAAQTIVGALNGPVGSSATVNCGGFVWRVGACGAGTELNVGPPGAVICQCTLAGSGQYSLRPCLAPNNANWGGIDTNTCGDPTQTITVEVTE